jgi:hypothetical protein
MENTKRAIEKCRELKPRVKFIKDRLFVVYSSNNSNVYHVHFDVQNGEKFGACECKAAEKGLICYHIIAAATANIYRQTVKQSVKPSLSAQSSAPYLKPTSNYQPEIFGGVRI